MAFYLSLETGFWIVRSTLLDGLPFRHGFSTRRQEDGGEGVERRRPFRRPRRNPATFRSARRRPDPTNPLKIPVGDRDHGARSD